VWAATDTFGFGNLLVGIRSDPAGVTDRVRAIFAEHAVEEVSALPNYSIRLEMPVSGRKGPPRAYALYRSQCLFLRTRTQKRALRALVRCVSAHTDARSGHVRVRQAAVVGRSGAVILPAELAWRLESIEPSLQGDGIWLVDPPLVEIDTGTRELIVAPPAVGAASALFGAGSDGSAPLGRYPIEEWALLSRGNDEEVSVQAALAAVMPMVDADMSDPAAFKWMLRTLSTARLTQIRHAPAARLLERLVGMSGG
jgi:hypothetical protein